MQFIFWFSIFMIFYAYFGYPLTLWIIALLKPKQPNELNKPKQPYEPTVSLLISAYNEEDVIEEKILNSLSLEYPKELFEILVVSDGSTDRTDEITARYSKDGVILKNYEGRIGKTSCLNRAVPEAKGEIIVFSDANSIYNNKAIRNLIKHFKDTSIGFVTGRTKYVSQYGDSVAESTNLYTKLELITKSLESKIFSCVGADGAIFAIRKMLFNSLKDYDINDFVIPLNIIEQGYRGLLDIDAFCIEKTARDSEGEFNRQVRISCRTIRAIFNNKVLLNPIKHPIFSFELISHKILKFMLPFFMIGVFVANAVIISKGILYFITFAMQMFYYLFFLYGYSERKKKDGSRLAGIAYAFGTVNFAILVGWWKYFSGQTYTTWRSERP